MYAQRPPFLRGKMRPAVRRRLAATVTIPRPPGILARRFRRPISKQARAIAEERRRRLNLMAYQTGAFDDAGDGTAFLQQQQFADEWWEAYTQQLQYADEETLGIAVAAAAPIAIGVGRRVKKIFKKPAHKVAEEKVRSLVPAALAGDAAALAALEHGAIYAATTRAKNVYRAALARVKAEMAKRPQLAPGVPLPAGVPGAPGLPPLFPPAAPAEAVPPPAGPVEAGVAPPAPAGAGIAKALPLIGIAFALLSAVGGGRGR